MRRAVHVFDHMRQVRLHLAHRVQQLADLAVGAHVDALRQVAVLDALRGLRASRSGSTIERVSVTAAATAINTATPPSASSFHVLSRASCWPPAARSPARCNTAALKPCNDCS